jgi:flagellar hook protein FlgE
MFRLGNIWIFNKCHGKFDAVNSPGKLVPVGKLEFMNFANRTKISHVGTNVAVDTNTGQIAVRQKNA